MQLMFDEQNDVLSIKFDTPKERNLLVNFCGNAFTMEAAYKKNLKSMLSPQFHPQIDVNCLAMRKILSAISTKIPYAYNVKLIEPVTETA